MRPAVKSKRTAKITPIGLDIGAAAVRAVQLQRSGSRWVVLRASTWQIPPGAGIDGVCSTVTERLNRAAWEQEFIGREVVVGLSAPDVELHALELPQAGDSMGQDQFGSAAHWEIERLCSMGGQEIQTAHWRLPKTQGHACSAIGVATAVSMVTQIWQACSQAKMECSRVDATACALARAVALMRPGAPESVWGILDIGARGCRLILCVDRTPILVRSLGAGGIHWTELIAKSLQVSTGAAETHKLDHGITKPKTATSPGTGLEVQHSSGGLDELSALILTALRTELDHLVGEIERSYEYALQCYRGRSVGFLVLSGGGSTMHNLDHYLENRLGIPVEPANAFLEQGCSARASYAVGGRAEKPMSTYLGAIGLALDPEIDL